jgi:2-polyprenyl-6-methoxyphenol hydroxylase-like FAD-dependent oxidoreductase
VTVDRLTQWSRAGLLRIGDAAHAMSPIGGVGINLAIQDAVAAANLLAEPLRERRVTEAVLAEVQQRREFPTRVTQRLQVGAHSAFERVFETKGPLKAPWQLKVVARMPGRAWAMGYVVGIGVRPEHVASVVRSEPEWSLKKAAVSAGALLGALVTTLRTLRG